MLQNTAILCTFHIISVSADNNIPNIHFCLVKKRKCKKEVNCEGGEVGGESVGQNAGKASARGVTNNSQPMGITFLHCMYYLSLMSL